MTLEYELVDANEVCQGIQKVRVEPATRSAVATWSTSEKKFRMKKRIAQSTTSPTLGVDNSRPLLATYAQ